MKAVIYARLAELPPLRFLLRWSEWSGSDNWAPRWKRGLRPTVMVNIPDMKNGLLTTSRGTKEAAARWARGGGQGVGGTGSEGAVGGAGSGGAVSGGAGSGYVEI